MELISFKIELLALFEPVLNKVYIIIRLLFVSFFELAYSEFFNDAFFIHYAHVGITTPVASVARAFHATSVAVPFPPVAYVTVTPSAIAVVISATVRTTSVGEAPAATAETV